MCKNYLKYWNATPKNRKPVSCERSIKFDLRWGGRWLSIKSKRAVRYCAAVITVVKFPVPAKSSMKSYTWQRLDASSWMVRKGWEISSLSYHSGWCHGWVYSNQIWLIRLIYTWSSIPFPCWRFSRLWARIRPKNHQDDQYILLAEKQTNMALRLPQANISEYLTVFDCWNQSDWRFFNIWPGIKRTWVSLGTWSLYKRHTNALMSIMAMDR